MPGSSTFYRFISRLMENESGMEKIIQALIKTMYELIPNFSDTCVVDGKITDIYALPFK